MNTNQSESPTSFGARSTRSTSRLARAQPKSSQNARQGYEHYLALARAKASAGDRIEAENFFQHAEHFFRLMGENAN
jgi:hypothetical protein